MPLYHSYAERDSTREGNNGTPKLAEEPTNEGSTSSLAQDVSLSSQIQQPQAISKKL